MDFKKKPILGMIHLSGQHVVERAKFELDIYKEEGVHGAIIENYHSGPDMLEIVLEAIDWSNYSDLLLGINILPNDYEKALELADKYNFDFIQLDNVAGTYVNNQSVDEEDYLMVRQKYPNIKVLGGVWPKYYQPVAESNIKDDLESGMFRSDVVVVTGSGTGKETPLDKIKNFRSEIGDFPLIVGAGLNTDNVQEQLRIADGAIVGSCFKPFSRTNEPVKRELVIEFMDNVKNL